MTDMLDKAIYDLCNARQKWGDKKYHVVLESGEEGNAGRRGWRDEHTDIEEEDADTENILDHILERCLLYAPDKIWLLRQIQGDVHNLARRWWSMKEMILDERVWGVDLPELVSRGLIRRIR